MKYVLVQYIYSKNCWVNSKYTHKKKKPQKPCNNNSRSYKGQEHFHERFKQNTNMISLDNNKNTCIS